ncbi:MAG: HEAT repeat domain-containing protein, partial [Planctomycetaceae bacterium]
NEVRWLAVQVSLINLTGKEITVLPEDYTLSADGTSMKLTELPSQIQSMSFQSGNQTHRLSSLKTQKLTLPHGANGQAWLVFAGLQKGSLPRRLELSIARPDGKSTTVDIVEYFGRMLGVGVERVGPRDSLAVMTIKGELNTVSLLQMVDQLERLVADRVARVVVRWEQGAPAAENTILTWLRQVASRSGQQELVNHLYPAVPSSIADFHIVDPQPGSSSTSYRTTIVNGVRRSVAFNPYAKNVHKSVEVAIASALRSAYQVLPREELLEEIENGHRLTRAAALSVGGGRLSSEYLPVIVRLANDDDVEIQRGALIALRHFGEPQAVETLVHYARKNSELLGVTAVESLAGSRYANAHGELLSLLQEDSLASRKEIVKILGKYARPIWADTLYGFVTDKNSGVRAEALAALVNIGDERVFALLQQALKGDDRALSEAALTHLIGLEDRASEKLALDWTLAYIEKSPPTSAMQQLLSKTKDQRAVGPLLKHLENRKGSQSELINTLAQIGDESVGETLAMLFDGLGSNEKRSVLNALYQLRTPAFQQIARAALKAADSNLLRTACQLLQQDASPASVEILVEGLKASSSSVQYSYICNALGAIATSEARSALRKAVTQADGNQKNLALQALQNLYVRSPGMIYVRQGEGWFKQKNAQKALTFYNLAVQIDPELPQARRARANQLLRVKEISDEQLATVQDDYRKLVELEPDNSTTWTGLGLVLIRLGKIQAGIRHGEDIRSKFTGQNIFHYNMACIYGRSIEVLREKPELTEKDRQQIEGWQKQAMSDLRASVEKGFKDLGWLQEDPDLDSLRELPDYKTFVKEKLPDQAADAQQKGAVPQKGGVPQKGAAPQKGGVLQKRAVLPRPVPVRIRVPVLRKKKPPL